MTTTNPTAPAPSTDAMREASDRRLAATPKFAPLPIARRLPPRSRRHSVSHRAYR